MRIFQGVIKFGFFIHFVAAADPERASVIGNRIAKDVEEKDINSPAAPGKANLVARHKVEDVDLRPNPMTPAGGGLVDSAMAAFGLTLLTEPGDKTFFVTAILAAKKSRLNVLLGATSALWVQTVLCALAGYILQYSPNLFPMNPAWQRLPLGRWIAGIALMVFGFINLYEARYMQDADVSEDENGSMDIEGVLNDVKTSPLPWTVPTRESISSIAEIESNLTPIGMMPGSPRLYTPLLQVTSRRESAISQRHIAEACAIVRKKESSRVSYGTILLAFTTVFAAEMGDRSMFSTVALATAGNAVGVALGACFAHSLVCVMAVCCSGLICKLISERAMTLIAGLLFLALGVKSLT